MRCPPEESSSVKYLVAIGVGSAIVVLFVAFIILSRRGSKGTLRALLSGVQQFSVILLFPVDWPPFIQDLKNVLQGVNLDVSLLSPACLGWNPNYYARFGLCVGSSALAFLAIWSLMIRYMRANGETARQERNNRIRDSVLLMLLLHPTISGQAFYFFRCRRIPGP